MANTVSARKAVRKIKARTVITKSRRSRVKTFLNNVKQAIADQDYEKAKAALIEAESETMKAVSKGVLHIKTGSRKISRMAQAVKKIKP